MSSVVPAAKPYIKLQPPIQRHPLRRERLFTQLDLFRQHAPLIWVSGPPGSGKTVLASSYLEANSLPTFWYRLDQNDADPSCLFYFLSQILPQASLALPRLPPTPLPELRRCARLFFRDFYARLPENAVLVLDNVHEFPWEQAGELLGLAFHEIPAGRTVLALGRIPPPTGLSGLELNGGMLSLGWEALRFTRSEARALAGIATRQSPRSQEWLEQAEGWAAAIVLMRDTLLTDGQSADDALPGQDAIFRYLAGELLLHLPAPARPLLTLLSLLPDLSAKEARQLADEEGGRELLQLLRAGHCLVELRGTPPTYHFHPLLRQFLRQELRYYLAPAELERLVRRSAELLEQRDQAAQAVLLYRNAGAFEPLAGLLCRVAQPMIASGQSATWLAWLSTVPPALPASQPWLRYWEGKARLGCDGSLAYKALLQAEQTFHALGNAQGRMLAAAALIENHLCWQGGGDHASLIAWTRILAHGLQQVQPNPEDALPLLSQLSLALAACAPDANLLATACERTMRALNAALDPQARLAAGSALLRCHYALAAEDLDYLLAELPPLAEGTGVAATVRLAWQLGLSTVYLERQGETARAQAALDQASRLADEYSLDGAAFILETARLDVALATANLAQARCSLARLQALPHGPRGQADLVLAEASLWRLEGDSQAAMQRIQRAILEANGIPLTQLARLHRLLGLLHGQADNSSTAEKWHARAHQLAFGREREQGDLERRLVVCHAAGLKDKTAPQSRALLANTLSEHRRSGIPAFLIRNPAVASALAAWALQEKLEVQHVRTIIKRQQLSPPDLLTPDWPWPIAVRSLGRLEISLDGNALKANGKVPQRPLMLLKALLCGGESGKLLGSIADQLWPETELAKSALNVTIHRLRRLLNSDAAVQVASGMVTLNRQLVWSDVAALSDVCGLVEKLPPQASAEQISHLGATLLDLYRGPFCDGEDSSWLMAARDRCRNHFLIAANELGRRLEALDCWADANQLYLHALDNEPLAEAIHRGLMRCAHARQDPAAAYSAYRRCRDTLSIVLGRKPSAETERLAVTLGLY